MEDGTHPILSRTLYLSMLRTSFMLAAIPRGTVAGSVSPPLTCVGGAGTEDGERSVSVPQQVRQPGKRGSYHAGNGTRGV